MIIPDSIRSAGKDVQKRVLMKKQNYFNASKIDLTALKSISDADIDEYIKANMPSKFAAYEIDEIYLTTARGKYELQITISGKSSIEGRAVSASQYYELYYPVG